MKARSIKVIFDTNVWISFLIGKKLHAVADYIVDDKITIVISDQLLLEIKEVTKRPKLQKYFPAKSVAELIDLLEIVAIKAEMSPTNSLCNDPKDNFLLDMIEHSKADILVTGDKDVLEINRFKTAKILTPAQFEKYMKEGS